MMRFIDSALGGVLSILISPFLRKRGSLQGVPLKLKRGDTVVFSKFQGLGSSVYILPVLETFKKAGVHVVFIGLPANAELIAYTQRADQILTVRPTLGGVIPSAFLALWRLRGYKPDFYLDFEPTSFLSALVGWLSKAPHRVGLLTGKPRREKFFTHLISYSSEKHLGAIFARFTRAFGLAETSQPSALRSRLPRQKGPLRIIFNVNASDLSLLRLWPSAHWVELARLTLSSGLEPRLVFSGLPSEKKRVAGIVEAIQNQSGHSPFLVENAAGKTGLADFMKALESSDIVVSVDSSALHLAAWLGVPCIGLFGPENPDFLSPPFPWVQALSLRLNCSPCLTIATNKVSRCQSNSCLKELPASKVYEKLLPLAKSLASGSLERGAAN